MIFNPKLDEYREIFEVEVAEHVMPRRPNFSFAELLGWEIDNQVVNSLLNEARKMEFEKNPDQSFSILGILKIKRSQCGLNYGLQNETSVLSARFLTGR